MEFAGKVALITGGVSGIGFGIARAFSDAGMALILTYRDEVHRASAELWFDEMDRKQPRYLKLDVTDRDRWSEIADEAGQVHVLVNNAGVSVFGPTDEASHADYDWIMGVNFGGVANGLVAMLPGMKAHGEGGHVISVASMAAFCAGPQAGIYTASKFAVRGLTESLRYNLAPFGIGVSLVCPGLTATNAWDCALKRPEAFGDSGFAAPVRAELEDFGKAFELGMDPREVGEKVLAGMRANKGLILTHPDHREDFEEICAAMMTALPEEPIPEGRAEIERMRREGNRAAAAGMRVGIVDMI